MGRQSEEKGSHVAPSTDGSAGVLHERLGPLLANIPEPAFVIQDGTIVGFNQAAELLTPDVRCGDELEQSIAPGHREAITHSITRALNGDAPVTVHAVFFTRDGQGHGRDVTLERIDGSSALMLCKRPALEEEDRLRAAEEVNEVLRQEIAGHRRTQEALTQSRRFARALVESSLDMIIAADPQGRITEFNPAAGLRFGYEAEEVIGLETRRLYARQDEFELIQREMDAHGVFIGEIRNITKFGEEFTSFLSASRLHDDEGRYLGAMGVSRDVTQTRKDQEALKASEERYRDLFEHASDLIQSVDADGAFQYVNNAWRERLGYSEEEIATMTIWDVVEPGEHPHCKEMFGRLMNGEPVGEITTSFVRKDGRIVRVTGNSNARYLNGRPVATRSIFRDITAQFDAQERVREQDAKLRALFESSEHMFWTVDQRIALTSFNKGYADMVERLYGIRAEINHDHRAPRKKFASEEYHSFWESKYAIAFAGTPVRFETDLLDKTGHRVCNEIFLSPVFDRNGSVSEVFGIGHEITEQKQAEDLVREQGARLQAIFDSTANMMIWTLDREFRLTSCNEHFQTSIGDAFQERYEIGTPFIRGMAEHVAGGRPERFIAKYHNALKGTPQQFEVELVGAGGSPIWVENFLNPIMVNNRVEGVSCLAHTITEKKRAQAELLDSLREKEVLLKEVHHRVKNNLQVISSILNLQSDHVEGDERILALLRDSQARIRSMSYIHESLYQRKNFNSVDIGAYISTLSRNLMMSYSLSGRVELQLDVDSVELSLDQAIPCGLMINELISNALKHAFPADTDGKISIKVERTGRGVMISIADNGIGMPGGFSMERDANLGLQLVSTLIGQVDGRLDRRDGEGTRYEITFDIAPPRAIA